MLVRRLAVAFATAALVAGCGSDPDPEPAAAEDSASAPDTGASQDDEGADSGTTDSAGVEDVDTENAIVSQTVSMPADPKDSVEISVLSLKVEGEVMQLRLALTPDFASVSDSDTVKLFRAVGGSTFSPELIDVENLKEYSVVTTRGMSRWSSSDLGTEGVNGSPMTAFAWFAAPEDDIDAIDVRVTEFWPTFTDVPITR